MLRGRDRLLLILASLEDFFQDLADAGGLVSFSYQQIYGFVPPKYKRQNFYMAVKRALRAGYIEKVIKKGRPYLKISGRGREKLTWEFPLFAFQGKEWDKKWRVVLFDIEEANRRIRDMFRRKLYELGFGQLQKSVYLSPFPIEKEMREFIESLNLGKKAYLLVSSKFVAGDERALAEKVWSLQKINKEYGKILQELERKKIDEEEKRRVRARYLEVLLADPCLPGELLPKNWLGEKARRRVFQAGL